jgi:hypothetical protein
MAQQLTIKQTSTGYWVVRRGDVEIAGAVTRKGAEAERELASRLRDSGSRLASSERRRPSGMLGRRPG